MIEIYESYETHVLEYPGKGIIRNISPTLPDPELFRTNSPVPSHKQSGTTSTNPLPINNYLKTKEEIDAEFRFIASCGKMALHETQKAYASVGRFLHVAERNDYLHSVDEALSAPMEENY